MKTLYIKVSRPGMGSYTQRISDIGIIHEEVDEIQFSEVGEKLTLELVAMEEEEYKKLPEFIGW